MSIDIKDVDMSILDNYKKKELSYKELCGILDIKYTSGEAKTRQLEYIQCYYKLEKIKTKYKIVKKYEQPLEYIDLRQSPYYDDIEALILYALDSSENNCVNWSISKALRLTSMINTNYYLGREKLSDTSTVLEVDKQDLENFYIMTYNKLRAIFENVLKSMKRKYLIDFSIDTMICKKETNIKYNDLNEPELNEYGNIIYTVDKIYREATVEEQEKILQIGRETLLEMGYNNIQECFIHKQWDKYKNKMNSKLRKRCNIEFSYNGYTIVKNTKAIEKEVSNIFEHKHRLNKLIVEALYKSKDKLLPEDVEDREVLIDSLINIHTTLDLKNAIKNILRLEEEEEKDVLPF